MFSGLIEVKMDKEGFLVDDRGIRYSRTFPVKTANIKIYEKPYVMRTLDDIDQYFELGRELQSLSPRPNAWRKAGVLEWGIDTIVLPRELKEVVYNIHKIEFYHIGE